MLLLGVVKRNPLFLHEIEWKNNGFLFTTPNIIIFILFRTALIIIYYIVNNCYNCCNIELYKG